MEAIISQLSSLIHEKTNEEVITTLEEKLENSIEEVVDKPDFFELPTKNLLRIIQKSKTEDIEIIKKLVSKFSEHKGEESPLILNVVDTDYASLNEYIEVLSKLRTCPICKRIGNIIERNKTLPKRDYEGEIKDLKQKIAKLKNRTVFPKVINKPADFDKSICSAAENGKLESIIYLIKHCHTDVETKNCYGYTPLNSASGNGHIEVVKYLIKHCHADVETKNNDEETPLKRASRYGHIELVKYLIKHCHANVETENCYGYTPLNSASANGHIEVVKYLIKHCHANIETKNCYGYTPLNSASSNGHIEVVKYLIRHGAKVTEGDLRWARNSKIKEYLREHMS